MAITIAVRLAAARGPADRDRRADFRYFVALTDLARNVLSKQNFDVAINFPGNLSRVAVTDTPVDITIPLAADQRGADFQVFLGFQITEREMEFNRRRLDSAR